MTGKPNLNVLVVGAGSIGQRHMRNLHQLDTAVSVHRQRRSLDGEFQNLGFPVRTFPTLEQAFASIPDAVIVANRTDLHLPVALEAARRGFRLFIEKPLSHSMAGLPELLEIEARSGRPVEVGFSLRFNPCLRFIRDFLGSGELGRLHYANFRVGQYLPDWRPGTDYRESYSAIRSQGGGVLFDLIHEIDLAGWFLGDVSEVSAMLQHSSTLDIETESVAELGLRFKSGALAQIHLDYLRPGYGRCLEIVGTEGVLAWDYPTSRVTLAGRDGPSATLFEAPTFERNDMFLAQMKHFLDMVRQPELAPGVSLCDAVAAQKIAIAAHISHQERRFVRPESEEFT